MQRFQNVLLQTCSRNGGTSTVAVNVGRTRGARQHSKLSKSAIQQQHLAQSSSTSCSARMEKIGFPKASSSSLSMSGKSSSSLSRTTHWIQRTFSTSAVAMHGGKGRPAPGTGITVHFKNHKGELIKTVEGNEGDDIVDLSWEYDLDIEAACEKSIACSTCHIILDADSYDKLEEPTDEENDMLDMAFGLEDTSRLGCQCKLSKDLDGMTISLPSATRNFAVDGHKSKH